MKHIARLFCLALLLVCGIAHAQYIVDWRKLPGLARDIGVGADGSVWVTGGGAVAGGYGIYRWNGVGWDRTDGGAMRIDVDPSGNPWVVQSSGEVYRRDEGRWIKMPGLLSDIGIGSNGSVWGLAFASEAAGHVVVRWNGSAWQGLPGHAERIDVDSSGNAWLVNKAGEVWVWNGGSFSPVPGIRATDISVCRDQTFALDGTGVVYRYVPGSNYWLKVTQGLLAAISVDCEGFPWGVNAAGEIWSGNPTAISASAVRAVTPLNARWVGMQHPLFTGFAETAPGVWYMETATSGGRPMRLVQRNETSIQLKLAPGVPTTMAEQSDGYLLDFKRNAVFNNLNGDGPGFPITSRSTETGRTVTYIDFGIYSSGGLLVSRKVMSENFTNGVSTGWTLNSGGRRTAFATTAVSRSTQHVSWAGHQVDVVNRTCTVAGYVCKVLRLESVTGFNAGQLTMLMGGYLHTLTNISAGAEWQLQGRSSSDTVYTERERFLDVIEFRDTQSGDKVVRFNVTGTGPDQGRQPAGYWLGQTGAVTGAERHWKGQLGTIYAPVTPAKSPGFQIQNKTDFPILVTLEQVGCLYYQIVQPGQVFQRNTGSVWFTIKARLAPNLEEPTVGSCILKPAMYVGTILVVSALTVGTAGTSTAFILPTMMAIAAGQGAAIGVQAAVIANGGSSADGVAAKVGVVSLTQAGTTMGIALLSGGSLLSAAGMALTEVQIGMPINAAQIGLEAMTTKYAEQRDIDMIQADLIQEVSVSGAYAGWDWPIPDEYRVMPRYEITGGPRIRTTPNGSTIYLKQQSALRITRVN